MNTNKDSKTGKYIGIISNKIDMNLLLNKIKNGNTIKQIALELGISAEGLRKFLIKNNISYKNKIIYSSNDFFFDIDSENAFYWAGFIAADGNISNKSDFNLTLKLSDCNHIEKFKNSISCNAPITFKQPCEKIINNIKTKTSGSATIRFRNKHWLNSLTKFNIIPNKTKIYDIPEWILEHNLFKHFIRGYFDGDGWFATTTQNNKQKITWGICGNLSVVEKIKNNLEKKCNIEGHPYICKQKNIYKLTYQKQHDIVQIINYLYQDATVYLDRKYLLAQQAKELDKQTIFLYLDKDELQKAYQQLKSYKLVANKFKCSKSAIAKYIKKYNIK